MDGCHRTAAFLIEQGVDFVENDGFDGLTVDLAAVKQFQDTPWCTNENLWFVLELFQLVVDVGAAANARQAVRSVEFFVQVADNVSDLYGQLLCWRNDKQLVAALARCQFA